MQRPSSLFVVWNGMEWLFDDTMMMPVVDRWKTNGTCLITYFSSTFVPSFVCSSGSSLNLYSVSRFFPHCIRYKTHFGRKLIKIKQIYQTFVFVNLFKFNLNNEDVLLYCCFNIIDLNQRVE